MASQYRVLEHSPQTSRFNLSLGLNFFTRQAVVAQAPGRPRQVDL